MAQSHSHDEGGHAGHDHTVGANARSLTIALGLTGTFLIAELVGAWLFNSLALLSDAAHMFTDAAALAIALAAIRIGRRPADDKRTYGYRRFEILAAAFNALLLFAVAAYRDPTIAAVTSGCDWRICDLVSGARPCSLYLVIPPSDISRTKPLVRLMPRPQC